MIILSLLSFNLQFHPPPQPLNLFVERTRLFALSFPQSVLYWMDLGVSSVFRGT